MIGGRFADVLAGAQAGEEHAFAVLYRDLAPAVRGFARARGVPDPDDMVAETMTAVARGVGRFRGDETSFRSWVFTIAYRRVADDRRRAGRRARSRPLGEGEDWPGGLAAEETALEGLAAGPVLASLGGGPVFAALARLQPAQRDVVLLRVVADLPIRDVAALLGKREGAVKMAYVRALEHLRRELSADVPFGPLSAIAGEHDG